MPRAEPTEDATFPVYRVQAKCSNPECGRKGWTKALQKYPEGTVIETPCSSCVKSWEARIDSLHRHQGLGTLRSNRTQQDKPKPRLEHWTDRLP